MNIHEYQAKRIFKDYGINNDYFKDISRYKIKYKEVLVMVYD